MKGAGVVERAWLNVPFSEKDEAKAHGAWWDREAKRWYDPRPVTAHLQRWAPLPELPDLLPGEDRSFGSGLFVDLVPQTCWFSNVRTCVIERDWERVRRMIRRRAEHRCEACGAEEDRSVRRWLEGHERWSYDDRTGVQTLRRLVCLCSPCHLATHMGYASITGRTQEAQAHLRRVTGMTSRELFRHIDRAGQLWIERSAWTWDLDLRILTSAGVTVCSPPAPDQRAHQAEQVLDQVRHST
ncbi:DNA primase [Pseudonocardia sp. EV170527-09]|nr:DNA primase [Pseudonocardia sp. EV170527-09]